MVAMFFSACSATYILTWLLGYENNILIFIANVFAPALLIILLGTAALAEARTWRGKRKSDLQEILVRYIMILSVLIPTVMGAVRSGALASRHAAASGGAHISVLDANLLGSVDIASGFYDMLDELNPDIVTLQELNPTVSRHLQERVGARYQCQALQPKVGTYGMGVLAKRPCTLHNPSNELEGIGLPQMVNVELAEGRKLSVINFHTIPPHTLIKNRPDDNDIQRLSNAVIEREKFMRALILESRQRPSIATLMAGDLNATTRNRVYRIVRDLGFSDAWSVGSTFGGGTWPGPNFPLPSWLVRIDYIFHSPTLVAKTAKTLPEGYGSDHRGVFATFDLTPGVN